MGQKMRDVPANKVGKERADNQRACTHMCTRTHRVGVIEGGDERLI